MRSPEEDDKVNDLMREFDHAWSEYHTDPDIIKRLAARWECDIIRHELLRYKLDIELIRPDYRQSQNIKRRAAEIRVYQDDIIWLKSIQNDSE